jgi:hypothetical protein
MNSIWLKIAQDCGSGRVKSWSAGSSRTSGLLRAAESQPVERRRTFADTAERDAVRHGAGAWRSLSLPSNRIRGAAARATARSPRPAGRRRRGPAEQHYEDGHPVLQASREEDDIAAQQLLPWVATGRSLGRLPMVQYGLMVKACRQAQERWPDSVYAFRAKQALEEISERYAANYNITPRELDISRFLKPRQGTQGIRVEPVQR